MTIPELLIVIKFVLFPTVSSHAHNEKAGKTAWNWAASVKITKMKTKIQCLRSRCFVIIPCYYTTIECWYKLATVVDISVKKYQYTINKNNTIQREINYDHHFSSTDCLLIFVRVSSYFRTQQFSNYFKMLASLIGCWMFKQKPSGPAVPNSICFLFYTKNFTFRELHWNYRVLLVIFSFKII